MVKKLVSNNIGSSKLVAFLWDSGFLMGHPYQYNSHHEAAAAAHGTTPRMRCSFKRATAVVCGGNLVVVLYLLHSLLVPLYIRPGASHSSIVLIRQNGLSSFLSPSFLGFSFGSSG
jgi:hypothetical protein